MRPMIRASWCVALLLVAVPVLGQIPDLRGGWDLQMQVLLDGQNLPCEYVGSVQITTQDGAQFRGSAELELSFGPEPCPLMMSAILDGQWVDGLLQGLLDGGEAFGTAEFFGRLGQGPVTGVVTKAAPGTTYAGSFTALSGPFSDFGGTWSGVARGISVLEIPVLGPAGLTSLILLLLLGGAWLLMRGRLV